MFIQKSGPCIVVRCGYTANRQHSKGRNGGHTYLDDDDLGLGPGWGWGWGDFGPTYATSTISNIKNGDLLIDMVDPAKKKIVFRAYASGAFQSNPIKEDQQMDKAVDKIFKQFPPKEK